MVVCTPQESQLYTASIHPLTFSLLIFCSFRHFIKQVGGVYPISNTLQPTIIHLKFLHFPQHQLLLCTFFLILSSFQQPGNQSQLVLDMATAASNALSSATVASAAIAVRPQKRMSPKVKFLPGFNPYQGLKSQNRVIALGVPVSTEQCFAKFANSIRANSSSKNGGALSSTCNAAVEIFKIASIMNGLVLVGVAVGFALLRIEAAVEEAE